LYFARGAAGPEEVEDVPTPPTLLFRCEGDAAPSLMVQVLSDFCTNKNPQDDVGELLVATTLESVGGFCPCGVAMPSLFFV
jgi:hypothetical protein